MFNSEISVLSLSSCSDKLNSKQNKTKQNNMSDYQATSMMKAMPFTFEEVSIDRDNDLTLESNGAVQASELLGVFQVLTDEEDDLKCAAKVNLDQNRALYEIIFKKPSNQIKNKSTD